MLLCVTTATARKGVNERIETDSELLRCSPSNKNNELMLKYSIQLRGAAKIGMWLCGFVITSDHFHIKHFIGSIVNIQHRLVQLQLCHDKVWNCRCGPTSQSQNLRLHTWQLSFIQQPYYLFQTIDNTTDVAQIFGWTSAGCPLLTINSYLL